MLSSARRKSTVNRLVVRFSATCSLVALTLITATPHASAASVQTVAPVVAGPRSSLLGLVFWLLGGAAVFVAAILGVHGRTARVSKLSPLMLGPLHTRVAFQGERAGTPAAFQAAAIHAADFDAEAFETDLLERLSFDSDRATEAFDDDAFETALSAKDCATAGAAV